MQSTLIVGAGPGGTGALVWAAQHGRLDDWLAKGVTIVDRQPHLIGSIGDYIINSDSLGGMYLEIFHTPSGRKIFAALRSHPATRRLEEMRHGFPPLNIVGRHFRNVGAALEGCIARSGVSQFRASTEVEALRLRPDGSIAADSVDAAGNRELLVSRTAIMAIGGTQDQNRIFSRDLLPGFRLSPEYTNKLLFSDQLFRHAGLARAATLLNAAVHPKVVILGGSHSAFSAAWLLTSRTAVSFGDGDIKILLRRSPRIFYPNRAAAEADGMTVTDDDICPNTKGVNRLGGLRGDGREIWRRIDGRPGCDLERRVRLIPLSSELSAADLRAMLDDATVIVAAFGYRAETLPVFGVDGRRLALNADRGGTAVARDGSMLLCDGGTIPNLFGIGLGNGYRPWGHMGGEPNFDGQANSLWLYQNHIGEVVFRSIHECLDEHIDARLAVTG
jgi:hypothetical protein